MADVDTSFAFGIGDAFTSADLSAYEWANFAHECGLQPALVARELKQLAVSIRSELPAVRQHAIERGASVDVLERVANGIATECVRHIELAPEIPKVDPSIF
jgi:serine/threonine-protein kinase HipA